MKAKLIQESMGDVLKPKSYEDVKTAIPKKYAELVDDCYDIVLQNPDRFQVIEDLGFNPDVYGRYYYGFRFVFEEYPYDYHEFADKYEEKTKTCTLEYTKHNDGNEEVFIDITSADLDLRLPINSLDDFILRFKLYEPITEGLDLFKPKSETELKKEFKKKYPDFYKIHKELFPNSELNLSKSDENVEAYIAFSTTDRFGEEHTFMLKQDHYRTLPSISYLDKSRSGNGFGGIFVNQKIVLNAKQVEEYVNNILKPIYDMR